MLYESDNAECVVVVFALLPVTHVFNQCFYFSIDLDLNAIKYDKNKNSFLKVSLPLILIYKNGYKY